MGLTTFPEISRRMIAEGRPADTPAAAVRWGTRPDQETIIGTLASLPGAIEARGLKPPATIIVGEVVQLREKLQWYERLPLFGQKVVVTRAREQARELMARLHALGADVVEVPTIEIQPLRWQMGDLACYDWLIFTSVNGVRCFMDRIEDLRVLRGKICVIGPATRAAIEGMRLKVDLMGDEYVAESLLTAFGPHDLNGKRILIARAEVARDVLPQGLRARGAHVDVLEVYRTVAPQDLADRAVQVKDADWVTFTSSSTVENLVAAAGVDGIRRAKVATIGPVTSATARRLGIEVTVEASPYTVDGLVNAIERMA
jgi:uroporphyrinogen III methyltransferase/synthase